MENKLNKILDTKELSDNSKSTYKRSFLKINKLIGNPNSFIKYKNIENIKKVVEDNIKSDGSKKISYISIGMILKDVRGYKKISKQYTDLSFKLTNKINEKLKDNVMTEQQKDKVKNYSSLVDIVEELRSKKDKSEKDYNDYMLSYLYIIPTFTPRNEYMKINVVYNPNDINEKNNYILVEDKKITFILQDYKTKKKYERINYIYSKREEKEIREYIEYLNNPSILFNFNRQSLHKKLDKLLGSSVRFLRITKNDFLINQSKYRSKSFKEKEEFQIKNFQHSIYQAETSYKKNDLN
jgi:hypothetical protein